MNAVSAPVLADPSRASRWADLRLRIASALVLAPLALVCVWFGGLAWFLLVGVAGIGVCWEWVRMAGRWSRGTWAGCAYAMLAVLALGWLRADPVAGRAALVFLLVVVWASDIGAYIAGRLIGGRRLAPAISPGKTWSGAAGGLIAAMAGGAVVAALWRGRVEPAMLAAASLGVASQLGDLLESGVKRHYGVKDSSHLIPGHGGLFDRLDGLMASALVAGIWALAAGEGAAPWLIRNGL